MNYDLENPIMCIYSNVSFIWVLTSNNLIISQEDLKLNVSKRDLYLIKIAAKNVLT